MDELSGTYFNSSEKKTALRRNPSSSFSLAGVTLTPFSAIQLCWCKVVGIDSPAGACCRTVMAPLSKEYTGVKCWQMCGMNPCRYNNKISCPGRRGSMVRYGTRLRTAGRSMGWWLTFCRVWSSNSLGYWTFVEGKEDWLDGKSLFLWGERLRAEVSGGYVSPFHLVARVPFCGVLVFWFGCLVWVCCLWLFYGTQVFCNHCMSSSHTRESLTDKASCSIG